MDRGSAGRRAGRHLGNCHPQAPAPPQHPEAVSEGAWRPGTTELVTTCADNKVRHWDVTTGKESLVPFDMTQSLPRVAFSPDGRHLLVAGVPRQVRLLDADDWHVVTSYPVPAVQIGHELAFSGDGRRI